MPTPFERYNLQKAAYSVKEMTQILPLSRETIYKHVRAGNLRKSNPAGRTAFMAADVARFLDFLTQAASDQPGKAA